MKLPIALRPFLSFQHSALYESWKNGSPVWQLHETHQCDAAGAGFAPDIYAHIPHLQPITVRLKSVKGPLVWIEQVIGKDAGKLTNSLFRGEEMWSAIDPLKPWLERIAAATGNVMHFTTLAHSVKEEGKSVNFRHPIFLVETKILDDKGARIFSGKNFHASRNSEDERFADGEGYLRIVEKRNAEWLKTHDITFEDEVEEGLIPSLISLIQRGDITQNELIAALQEIDKVT